MFLPRSTTCDFVRPWRHRHGLCACLPVPAVPRMSCSSNPYWTWVSFHGASAASFWPSSRLPGEGKAILLSLFCSQAAIAPATPSLPDREYTILLFWS